MALTKNTKYLEDEILSADPMTLVRRLYEGALEGIAQARRHLREGGIRARSRAAMNAHAIVAELAQSLDHSRGGDLSRSLAQLYDYALRKILEANFKQQDAPLAEAASILQKLLEGWEGCQAIVNSSQPPDYAAPYSSSREPEYEPVSYAG